jgi:hypothetical protein
VLRGRTLKLAALAALVAPLAVATGLAVTGAQTPLTIQMAPTKGVEPGLTGSTTITPLGNNQFKVDITVNGLKPNDDRAAHIHSPGTDTTDPNGCDTGGPVVYPLTDVKADASGKGASTTTVTLDPAKGTPTTGWYVNVHTGAGANTGAGVICGKITTSLATAAGGGAAAGATPAAGGAAAPAAGGATQLPANGLGGPAPAHTDQIVALVLAAFAFGGVGLVFARKR